MTRGTPNRARRSLILAMLGASFALLVWAVVPGGAASPGRVRVGGALPAMPAARELGAVPAGQRLHLTVVLDAGNGGGLAAYAAAVSTPGSSEYRHFLSVHQFAARFGAADAAIATVRRTLRADGLQVGATTPNNLALAVVGDAAHVSRAFGVTLRRYREHSGREVFANTGAPTVPSSLRGIVSNVLGLNSLPAAVPEGIVDTRASSAHAASGPFAGGLGPVPCPAASSFAASTIGNDEPGDEEYTINQIAQAYGVDGLYAQGDYGQGVTIAMYELEAYPDQTSDLAAYQSCYGTNTQVTIEPDGFAGSPLSNVSAETSVDLENVIGLAPEANIEVFRGPNNYPGNYNTLNEVITSPTRPQVINDSWGICEADQVSGLQDDEATLLEEAASQGMTFISSSGDRGSQGCVPGPCPADNPNCSLWLPADTGPLQVDDPASQPYTTGVGGSDLSSISPVVETSWNEEYWGGSGGGLSQTWAMPSWQADAGVPGTINSYSSGVPCGAGSTPCREVPDVSADAAPHQGYTIYWNGSWSAAGGTSTAAPVWAAIAALADASNINGCTPAKPLGFLNPLLYEVAAGAGHASAFRDITVGDNNPTFSGPYEATPGYDLTSGLGTPIVTDGSSPGLVAQLCNAAQLGLGAPPTVSSLSVPEAAAGSQVTITGSNFTPYSAVWFGNSYAQNVTYLDSQHLLATVPPGSGSVNVEVLKISGVSSNSPATVFTYAPTESIASPVSGGAYTQGQALSASYSCASSTAGTPTCAGTAPDGSAISTANLGEQQFTVTATDANDFSTTTTATYTVVPPPAVAISGPVPNGTYAQGQVLPAQFSCATSAPVTIANCSAPVSEGAAIDTQSVGSHSFTVVATDSNGISTSRTVSYEVVSAPQTMISTPADGAVFVRGSSVVASYLCSATAPATIVSCAANTVTGGKIDTSTTGAHKFSATATDSDGVSTSASVGYTVVAVVPQISALRETSSHWATHGTKRTRLPVGTSFSFSLDQTAKVTLRFSRQRSGRIKAGHCVAPGRAPRGARSCRLALGAGTISVTGDHGANTVTFNGHTSSGNLSAGSYTVTLTAVGLSGKPSEPATLRFTVAAAG
jgi:subtilase family serine protease